MVSSLLILAKFEMLDASLYIHPSVFGFFIKTNFYKTNIYNVLYCDKTIIQQVGFWDYLNQGKNHNKENYIYGNEKNILLFVLRN